MVVQRFISTFLWHRSFQKPWQSQKAAHKNVEKKNQKQKTSEIKILKIRKVTSNQKDNFVFKERNILFTKLVYDHRIIYFLLLYLLSSYISLVFGSGYEWFWYWYRMISKAKTTTKNSSETKWNYHLSAHRSTSSIGRPPPSYCGWCTENVYPRKGTTQVKEQKGVYRESMSWSEV